MTNADKSHEDRRLDDERCVDGLLAEAGLPDDGELRDLLLELRNLRVTEVPAPSAELAALMGQPGPGDVVRLEDWPRKHPGKKRAVITTLAIAASLGVAGGAAASNDGLRSQAEGTISGIVGSLFRSAPEKPAPTAPVPAPQPAEAPKPAPAVVLPPSARTVPDPPAPRAEPSAGDRRESSQAPGRGRHVPDDVGPGHSASVMQPGGKTPGPGTAGPADVPGPASERPASGRPARGQAASDNGNAQGKAHENAGHQPRTAPAQGNSR